ncbi:hypothetical protein BDQ12DRAFT_707340 [Crucibulum laeve]|uniref:Adenylate kinase n=1 Tax=Crucibulum laeve TaxID=68775 RepID=A0A5C3LLW5_9AGAR|nr:hypothetical protein BDQ12DRAFT_707340 [Crucibulum laeve]
MQQNDVHPPLLGDRQGRYRVQVVGNSGSGKSTTGLALAKLLGVPCISLDRLFWKPNWEQSTREEFQAKIRAALDEAEGGWVVDGLYTKKGGLIVAEQATDIIWLDPPLLLYLPRIIVRTFLRLFRREPPCSPGCEESVKEIFFSKESIIWWCLSQHWVVRRRSWARMQEIGLGIGSDVERRKMRRIGGWGSQLKQWFSQVAALVEQR